MPVVIRMVTMLVLLPRYVSFARREPIFALVTFSSSKSLYS